MTCLALPVPKGSVQTSALGLAGQVGARGLQDAPGPLANSKPREVIKGHNITDNKVCAP